MAASSKAKSLLAFSVLLLVTLVWAGSEEVRDTREGENVTLQCRFTPPLSSESITYYWVRNTPDMHDNVAIGNIPLAVNYKLDYRPDQGRYDIIISNASYERDNGRFECRVKAGGSGQSVHSQAYNLTVLTAPQAPVVTPGARVSATEGREIQLSCSSTGGSPEPVIKWYRDGSKYALDAELVGAKFRFQASSASLVLNPTKDDDGAVFRCEVWNRALPEGVKLETSVALSVDYFPRVEVGPENPLKVEVDGTVTMECKVDSKPKVSNVRWTRNGRFVSTSLKHSLQKVSIQDAGKYTCSADNNLGKIGEQDIFLDVLYPPSVIVESKTRETEENGMVKIRCNVTANPEPISVEWTKEGKPDFRQNGDTLHLSRITAESAGTYICRATNIITSAGGKRTEKVGTSSVAVLVRHKPGKARISPDRPIAQEGSAVTLSCAANPPGWPAPQYRWFKDSDGQGSQQPTVMATGTKFNIPSAHLGSEGTYHCQATNELGHGEMASITLEVHQPPRFQVKLQPHLTRRVGDTDFSVTCSAHGKPKPNIRWLKNGAEITPEPNLYEVKTEITEGRSSIINVQSTLKFIGKARIEENKLLPEDRGVYSCVFENEVRDVESSMHLRIEHKPIVLHQYNKVAYDLRETAEVVCKMQAYPKPEFQWFFGTNTAPLVMSSEGHYEINTSNDNDTYTSILKVSNIKHQDYGDYYCRVINVLGELREQIKLQPKGPPEKPRNLKTKEVGHNYVSLIWEPGFNGGIQNTKYFVSYRRVAMPNNEVVTGDCSMMTSRNGEWMEFDCQRNVPCNVTSLDQHQSYVFKVKSFNTKGSSDFSNEIATTTKVDKIPSAEQVTFDPSTRKLSVSVGSTCLALVGVVETLVNGHTTMSNWQVVDTLPLHLSGNIPTFKEFTLTHLAQPSNRMGRNNGRSLTDEVNEASPGLAQVDELNPRVRVKLCLRVSHEHCGEYTEAEIGPSFIKEASALATPTLIAIIVSCIVFILFIGLLLMFCRCKRNQTKKQNTKDYEMESVRPSMVAAQNQAPPPYYPTTGLENKALEHSMDLALSMEDPKNAVYATQNGYGYHVAPNVQGHPGQNINGGEWINMGYMENSYSNSNNGGSVNSQDSLWQMKMAAAANNTVNNMAAPHQIIDRQNSYGYDPIAHGGYGAIDDYAHYPHMTHNSQTNMADDYNMRGSQNPSRQEYCTDPYASVHKPKKRMDQHIESPYHDVSGLPDPYMDQMETEEQKPPQHLSLSYDESLESGYSTPNSRTRRVIREIIV